MQSFLRPILMSRLMFGFFFKISTCKCEIFEEQSWWISRNLGEKRWPSVVCKMSQNEMRQEIRNNISLSTRIWFPRCNDETKEQEKESLVNKWKGYHVLLFPHKMWAAPSNICKFPKSEEDVKIPVHFIILVRNPAWTMTFHRGSILIARSLVRASYSGQF